MKKKSNHRLFLGFLLSLIPCLMAASRYSEMDYEYSGFEVTVVDFREDLEHDEYFFMI